MKRVTSKLAMLAGLRTSLFSAHISHESSQQQCFTLFNSIRHSAAVDVKAFIEAGNVDVNCQNEDGMTMLIVAAEHGKVETMKELISHGADVNLQDKLGNTAVIAASRENNCDAVKLLIAAGAQVDVKNYEGMNAADNTLDAELDKTLRDGQGPSGEPSNCCLR